MKEISNADYALTLRLLLAMSKTRGTTIREKENARKAGKLHKKLNKHATRQTIQVNPESSGIPVAKIFPTDGLD